MTEGNEGEAMGEFGKLSSLRIGLRSQDIQTSLHGIDLGALNPETKNIRLIGMAERLAIHIRGADVIDDYKRLEYIASQFDIDSLILPRVLNVLEKVDWIRVRSEGDKISKVEETVPYFSDIYGTMGDYYKRGHPTEIEDATLTVTDRLALSPVGEEEIQKKLGLEKNGYEMLLDIGKGGRFLNEYESPQTGERVLYSPLYWTENPEKIEAVFNLLKKFGAEKITGALRRVRDYQGFPLADNLLSGKPSELLREEDLIIFEAINKGILLAPKVDSLRGGKHFAFTPYVGIPIEEKIILEKAMAILACVRYGQHFGSITKIKYPAAILDSLLESPHRIGGPTGHTEIRRQYAILVGRGVGRIFPHRIFKDRYYFQLIETEENIKAVKLAKDLLAVGEVISEKGLIPELQEVLFYPGSYEEAARTLPKIKSSPHVSEETQEYIFNIMDALRGGG